MQMTSGWSGAWAVVGIARTTVASGKQRFGVGVSANVSVAQGTFLMNQSRGHF